jgi:hypothetical protein
MVNEPSGVLKINSINAVISKVFLQEVLDVSENSDLLEFLGSQKRNENGHLTHRGV